MRVPETRHNRGDVQTNDSRFIGQAVVYNSIGTPYCGLFNEIILPGAFDASLRSNRDVFCTINHNSSQVLGRKSAGTLSLTSDSDGIQVECPVADYSYARDLVTAISRRDISGMSFTFDVLDDEWNYEDGVRTRRVLTADLYEVSFVSEPAYPQTSADVRSAEKSAEKCVRARMFEAIDRPQLAMMRAKLRLVVNT